MFIPVLEAAPLVPDLNNCKTCIFIINICVSNKNMSYLILVSSFTEPESADVVGAESADVVGAESADVVGALSANHSKSPIWHQN